MYSWVLGNPIIYHYTWNSLIYESIGSFWSGAFMQFRDTFLYYLNQGLTFENIRWLVVFFLICLAVSFICAIIFHLLNNGFSSSSSLEVSDNVGKTIIRK